MVDTAHATRTVADAGTVHASELLTLLHDTAALLAALPPASATGGSRDAWVEVVRATQRILNTTSALQDEAIVALAAIEPVYLEDGTEGETHKAPGHVALDAPAIVSGALEVTAKHAQDRVRDAVRRAADGHAGTNTCTGLGGLHTAMRAGVLDRYRAGVVADELEEAPAEVAEAVIETLGEHLARETGVQLRRRTRRLLARISPDLLLQRAKRAREQLGLRRWVGEPGVDQWEGTFPSEDAAHAWAAIDARAQELVKAGAVERIERARAQALIDLVMGSATVTTVITLTTPAPADHPTATATKSAGDCEGAISAPTPSIHPAAQTDEDTPSGTTTGGRDRGFVEVATGRGTEQVLVPTAWLTDRIADATGGSGRPTRPVLDEGRTETDTKPATGVGTDSARQSHARDAGGTVRVENRSCDPVTGALLDQRQSTAYRPPESIAALVRQRDGTCRFPGCSIAARFCDLDHVRPWPTGPTAPANLICLCRRHHRIKQRPGWRVTLHPDATVTWTDPTGRHRTTLPVDALHTVRLPAPAPVGSDPRAETTAASVATSDATRTADAKGSGATATTAPGRPAPSRDRFSHLEFALEHLLGADLANLPTRTRRRATTGRPTVSVIRPVRTIEVVDAHRACRRSRPLRPASRAAPIDDPPF